MGRSSWTERTSRIQHSFWKTSWSCFADEGSKDCVQMGDVPAVPCTEKGKATVTVQMESTSHHCWQKTHPCFLHTPSSLLLVFFFNSQLKSLQQGTSPGQFRALQVWERGCSGEEEDEELDSHVWKHQKWSLEEVQRKWNDLLMIATNQRYGHTSWLQENPCREPWSQGLGDCKSSLKENSKLTASS